MTSKSPFCFASLEERTLAQSFLALLPRVLVQELRRILRSSVNLQDTMVPELCQKHCKNHWNVLRPEIQALYHGSFQERGTITRLKRMEQEAAAWSQNPICKITYPRFQVSSKQLLHFNAHSSVDSRLYPPPVHLGKGSRHQCPAVGESPPCHLQSSQPITVGPLVFPDPELDLPFTSVYHFLTHRALLSNQQHRLGFFL